VPGVPVGAAEAGRSVNAQGTSRLADDGVRWWRVFPGEAGQLEVLRRWIEDLLPSCPARDDVTAVACELAANAVCHTLSGDGGQFGVRITLEAVLATIAVADGGGTTEPKLVEDPLAEHGRGLRIVRALSADITVTGGIRGRIVQASVPWSADEAERDADTAGLAML
jgi:serine/threonine-protein kinase RsbW